MKIKNVLLIVLITLCIIPLIISTFVFTAISKNQNEKFLDETIKSITLSYAKNLDSFFMERQVSLELLSKQPAIRNLLLAYSTSQKNEFDNYKEIVSDILLTGKINQNYINNIYVVNKDGKIICSSDERKVGNEIEYANEVASLNVGEVFIKNISKADLSSQSIEYIHNNRYAIATPIYITGEYQGMVVELINDSYFAQLVNRNNLFNSGCITILDANEKIVATDKNLVANDCTLMAELDKKDFNQQPEGLINFYKKTIRKIGYYTWLPESGWLIVGSADWLEVTAPLAKTMRFTYIFIVVMLLLIICVYTYLKRKVTLSLEEVSSSIRNVLMGDYSVRIKYKRKDEFKEVCDAFNNLVATLEADTKELKHRDEIYDIVMNLSENIIVEWKIQDDIISCSPNWYTKFAYARVDSNVKEVLPIIDNIHEDDRETVKELIRQGELGTEFAENEVRIRRLDGQFIWCRVRITSILDDSGKPYKAIGAIIDIDREKREAEELLIKSETDTLTGFYNKGTTERLIKEYLNDEGKDLKHALLIIDIDNFKKINDNLGHLFGDAVLRELAAKVKKLFRSSDILGRIGGDEFMIFIKNLNSNNLPFQKAKSIVEVFRKSFTGDNQCYKVSGSLGISLYPSDGQTFAELYKNADTALYCAKNTGKDCYAAYDEIQNKNKEYEQIIHRPAEEKSQQSTPLCITRNIASGYIIEYIFKLLYQSKDKTTAMNSIMELVGKEFGVSRFYIIEEIPENPANTNIYQWCNEEEYPPVSKMQEVPGGLLETYKDCFDENGILYCYDFSILPESVQKTLKEQKVVSMLQCALIEDNEYIGLVGFDVCSENRYWTQSEIDILVIISNMVSTFILKTNTQQKLINSYEIAKIVMDNMENYCYVVDAQTYEILFISNKLNKIFPDANEGTKCYLSLWNKSDSACSKCPIENINIDYKAEKQDVYVEKLNKWFRNKCIKMLWTDGRPVYLLSCEDITEYKTEGEIETVK